jgi:type I restriction enzyme S subunit
MDADLFLQQFGHLAQGEGGIKKLRDVLLQLAVQGKLIAQSHIDEPAQTLLKKINPKATKIDGLYEIPSNWVWTKLEAVSAYIQRGKGPTYSDVKQVPVVSQKCVQWRGFDFALARFIDPETLQNYQEERFLVAGDLLWNSTGTGTLGRVCIYPGSDLYSKVVADSHVTIVRLNSMEPRYVWCFLASPIVQMNIEASGSTNQIELSTSTVKNHPVPIPPLAEQKRIVAKVDELMALCDKLEAEQKAQRTLKTQSVQSTLHHLTNAERPASFGSSLNILERTFGNWFDDLATVKHLRATILQLAVQGKLVPQNPTDEPAIELLKKLAKERALLLKSGLPNASEASVQINKQKKQILPSKLPSIPKGWAWATLMQCSHLVVDCHNKTAPYVGSGIPLLRTSNIRNGKLVFSDLRYVTEATYERWSARCEPIAKDILITREAPMGEVAIIPEKLKVCMGQRMMLVRLIENTIDHKFLLYSLQDPNLMERVQDKPVGMTVQHLRVGGIETLLIPLPPLAEQKRIVAKVDELMTLCDQLEAHITHTQKLNTYLMDSLIHRMTEAA